MFGLEFLFAAALWALPLAALPLILHLLYRRKSPVVPFPTLRFIQSSLQQSAARRKVQRWLLLAIRMLLLALLIWAIAQPAKVLASRFFGSNQGTVAIVVVDTSWSMQYQGANQLPLIAEADQIVQQLLRDKLRDASVMLATSGSDLNKLPFRSSSEILAQWVPLKPEPARAQSPLSDAVTSAAEIFGRNPAAQKLLVIISDFQTTDFPRPLSHSADEQLRIVAVDLHPDRPRSSGISSITLKPAQVVAGIRASVEVEVAGAPGEVRPVSLSVTNLDGKGILARPPLMANIDDSGHTTLRFDLEVPNEHWQLITAKLQGQDPMPWDDARSLAIELPPQQRVLVWDADPAMAGPQRLVRLALDPAEGKLANWPLRVETGSATRGGQGAGAVVALLDQAPSAATARQWRDLVTSGGKLVLLLRPGIESTWAAAPAEVRTILEQLLPSAPYETPREDLLRITPTSAARQDPVTAGLADDPKALADLRANRLVGLKVADQRSTQLLLAAAVGDRRAPADHNGLLYSRKVGRGKVYTWACIPEGVTTNLGTHPLFLPLLVNQCLRGQETSLATNPQIGSPITLDESEAQGGIELLSPGGQAYQPPLESHNGRRGYSYADTAQPGLYRWRKPGEGIVRAVANVTAPPGESEAIYRPAETILPQTSATLVARSMQDLDAKIAQVSQPQPRWSMPLAIALILLCAEGLLSNETAMWKWFGRR